MIAGFHIDICADTSVNFGAAKNPPPGTNSWFSLIKGLDPNQSRVFFEKELQRRIEMALKGYDEEFNRLRFELINYQGGTDIPLPNCGYLIFKTLGDMRNVSLERRLFLKIVRHLAEYCRIECPYGRTWKLLQYSESDFFDDSMLASSGSDEWIVRRAYRKATGALQRAIGEEAYQVQKEQDND